MADKKDQDEITIREMARRHTMTALRTLLHQCLYGKKEQAKISAAMGLLAYGWGRPPQALQHEISANGGLLTSLLEAHSHASELIDTMPVLERVKDEDELLNYDSPKTKLAR